MQAIWQDIRYGVRMLVRKPGFTISRVVDPGAWDCDNDCHLHRGRRCAVAETPRCLIPASGCYSQSTSENKPAPYPGISSAIH